MEIRYINQAFSNGIPTPIPVGGRYLRVLAAPHSFKLEVQRNGSYEASLDDAAVGDTVKVAPGGQGFDGIRVTATADDTIKIAITDGEVYRDTGNTDVSDRATRLLGVVYGSLGAQLLQILSNGLNLLGTLCHGTLGQLAQLAVGGVNALCVTSAGKKYASSYTSSAGLNNSASQVFSVASNPNGATLWNANMCTQAASTVVVTLHAHTAAPTSVSDGNILLAASNQAANQLGPVNTLEDPIDIPANKGVWAFNGGTETGALRSALYTLR